MCGILGDKKNQGSYLTLNFWEFLMDFFSNLKDFILSRNETKKCLLLVDIS